MSNSSDLWSYFLVKSVSHLNTNGSIGLILPWAFIQADYAKDLRLWLIDQFQTIRVLALNNPYFKSAQERVVVVWLKNKGQKTSDIEFAFAKNIESSINYKKLGLSEWNSDRVVGSSHNLNEIFDLLINDLNFSSFGTFADSRIGVVTGANKFFIRKREDLISLGFNQSQLIPILTSAKELPSFITTGQESLKCLICLTENEGAVFTDFIHEGEELEYDQRSHSKMRKPWFAISPGKIPDGFFPYRVGRIPYLVLNDAQIQSTNSIHRIYFKDEITSIEMKWIHVSMLSVYGQLSLEANSKTYGRGMLKMEPGALSKALVYKSRYKQIDDIYDQIVSKLGLGEKDMATQIATNFIDEFLNVPNDLRSLTSGALEDIKKTRKR